MAIKNRFFKNQTEKTGTVTDIVCPACGQTVSMELFRNYDQFNALALIKGENGELHFAVCSQCACVFSVRKEYAEAVNAGQTVYMTPDDLTLLVKGS